MEPTPMALDERLSAYLDGELAPTAVADLEARIAQDPALAVRVQELRNVSTLLRSAYAAPVDAYGSTHLRPPMPVAAPRPLSPPACLRGGGQHRRAGPCRRRGRLDTAPS